MPGFFYEEFHDGVNYEGQPHGRLYWAMVADIADGWKNHATTTNDGAYVWRYALSDDPADEVVEDTVYAGVTIPFITVSFLAGAEQATLPVYASDVLATAAALDVVVPRRIATRCAT